MKRLLFVLFVLSFIGVLNAAAATYTWNGNTNVNWSVNSNWTPSTGHPVAGDIANIPATAIAKMPTVDVPSACTTINVTGATTITLASTLAVSGALNLVNNNTVLTFAGTGSATISGGFSMSFNARFVINTGPTITFSGSIVTMQGNTTNTWVNSGTLVFLNTTLNFANVTTLTNNGTLTMTSSTFNHPGNNNVIDNFGTASATSCTFNFSSQNSGIKNESTGTFTGVTSTFNLSQNSTFLTNANTFTLTSCPTNMPGFQSFITNSGTGSTFRVMSSAITMGTANQTMITNNSGAFFVINAGSSITMNSFTGGITNAGTFYNGTSNSPCVTSISSQSSFVNNTGTFYVGSTSGVTLTGITSAVNNSSFFIIQSDQFGSGYIGTIPTLSPAASSPKFNGNSYYVERYLSANRGYRFGSSPVNNSTDASGNKIYSINYLQTTMYLTGDAGGGFDKTGNPSVYLFRENFKPLYTNFYDSNFRGIASLNSSPSYTIDQDAGSYGIPIGNGFQYFFRGDRALGTLIAQTSTSSTATVATITAIGSLNQGTIVVHDWYTPASGNLGYTTTTGNDAVRGNNLVGNPYPSTIDWDKFSSTTSTAGIYGPNVSSTIYSYNYTNKNFATYTANGTGNNGGTHLIPSGQGFIVIVKSSTATALTFNETAKTTSQISSTNLLMGKPVNQANTLQVLRLKLAMDSINTDDIAIQFKNSANDSYAENEDAAYMQGFGAVSLSSRSSDNVRLAVNVTPFPNQQQKLINLDVNAAANGTYQLSNMQITGVPKLYDFWLIDTYKKDSVNLRLTPSYQFDVVKTDSTTFGSKRFKVAVRQNPDYAYQLVNFTADKVPGKRVQLVWTTKNEENYTNFTVERSIDGGNTYNVLGGPKAAGQGQYSLLDKNPVTGENIYRLKQEDINNTITYSNPAKIFYAAPANALDNSISVYPNPAKSILNLKIGEFIYYTSYNITIENSNGTVVKEGVTAQPEWQTNVGNLPPGTYAIRVTNTKTKATVGRVKFLKM